MHEPAAAGAQRGRYPGKRGSGGWHHARRRRNQTDRSFSVRSLASGRGYSSLALAALGMVALIAALGPALRASKTDPIQALRME